MKTIVEMQYGSHLYGLATETSDHDYKGVFLPDMRSILLGKIPKPFNKNIKKSLGDKNGPEDTDIEFFSLHHFINMACEGNTIALDMLHAPSDMLIQSSPVWDMIRNNRSLFYTKKLKSYLGYARTQCHLYGRKGHRLKSALMVKEYLECVMYKHVFLSTVWSTLPTDDNVQFVTTETPHGGPHLPKTFYEVCGRKIQDTLTIQQAIEIVDNITKNYGERAKKSMSGTDFKAVTHAVRACLQLMELYKDGTITFPLKDRELLMKIKLGQLDFETMISPMLDNLINVVEELCNHSALPDKVNRQFWDDFIIDVIKNNS